MVKLEGEGTLRLLAKRKCSSQRVHFIHNVQIGVQNTCCLVTERLNLILVSTSHVKISMFLNVKRGRDYARSSHTLELLSLISVFQS